VKNLLTFFALVMLAGVAVPNKTALGESARAQAAGATSTTFHNPLLPSGADPWVTYADGFYYYMNTTGDNLTIWKTRNVADLATAEKKVVWTPPASGAYSKEIWAPELHRIQGKWYIYFAADGGSNDTHRIWAIENASADPLQGTWEFKGKVADPSDKWAIDASVFENGGRLYMVWSGWEGDTNGVQSIYLAQMKNPWTIEGRRVRISTPEYPWEKVGDLDPQNRVIDLPHVDVNEGPEVLQHGGSIFLVYSASGCWANYYELGMLTARASSNLMDPASWKKSSRPVFRQDPQAGAFGTGHNSFFRSADGKTDWILYHANARINQGCGGNRAPRAQPFTWNPDGTPEFGKPLPLDQEIPRP